MSLRCRTVSYGARGLPVLPLRARLLSPVGRVTLCAPPRELPRDRTSLCDDRLSPALSRPPGGIATRQNVEAIEVRVRA